MNLPPALASKIELEWQKKYGNSVQITDVQSCGGGCINQTAILKIGGQSAFLKFNSGVPENFFEAEANGLRALYGADTVIVPEVYLVGPEGDDHPAFLVLEALTQDASAKNSARLFGEDLAALHRSSQACYGFSEDNYIGSTAQVNSLKETWIEFFRDCRLRPQCDWICQKNSVSQSFKDQFETLLGRLEELLIPGEAPSLIHGDLWSGNSMTVQGGRTAIYDPAVYYGHREADLAMTELFGRLPQEFYDAYKACYPLDPGYEERRDLYNLYHMLNHWNLFGGSYRRSCESIIQSYL
ncbi:MAG: fructosamine kinase family protein [Planctomycetota bacterium]|nr:fructosamine kinase family protein [Planctomycetota bacterium]